MKNELVHALTESFEGHAQETENGVEYWLARDVQHLLGYSEWRNFLNVVGKAKPPVKVRDMPSKTILLISTKWSNSAPEARGKSATSC